MYEMWMHETDKDKNVKDHLYNMLQSIFEYSYGGPQCEDLGW